MTQDELNAYERLRAELPIDELNLDGELRRLPFLQMEAVEYSTAAKQRMDLADFHYDVQHADAMATLRETIIAERTTKPPSQDFLKAEVLLYQEVRDSKEAFLDAARDYGLWAGLSNAIRTKSTSITTISDLLKTGYMTPESVHAKRRDQVIAHRQPFRRPA
jgi:hypothetical protein